MRVITITLSPLLKLMATYEKEYFLILFLLFSLITASQAAGISVGGTRFVYDDNLREISIPNYEYG
ncbi:fimbrial chaperone [Proteus mirabilis]|uniref:Fimbrial chaperone n=1 Tax=Proteus mirabilis TaxID=584 RepID=A0A379FED4_PROMI|nr:fimbrial chaperone [Proteus mirabilis]